MRDRVCTGGEGGGGGGGKMGSGWEARVLIPWDRLFQLSEVMYI